MSDKIELTYEKALELLDRTVEEKGADYVAPGATGWGCHYFEYGKEGEPPSCIVGHVLNYLDPSLRQADEVVHNESSDSVLDGLSLTSDQRVYTLLEVAQVHQDSATPWGEAVAIAKRAAERVLA